MREISFFGYLLIFILMGLLVSLEASGLPQLDASKYSQQIFWFIVAFGSLYLFVNYFVIPRLKKIKTTRNNIVLSNIEHSIKIKKNIELINLDIEESKRKAKENESISRADLLKKIAELTKSKADELEIHKTEKILELKTKQDALVEHVDRNRDQYVNDLYSLIIEKLNLTKR